MDVLTWQNAPGGPIDVEYLEILRDGVPVALQLPDTG